jgi:L-asparaginase II
MGEPTKGYAGTDHPVQKRLINILQEMGEVDLGNAPRGCDGCGIPVIAMPLDAMALGFAKIASPDDLSPMRREAAKKTGAIQTNPLMVAGHRRLDSLVIEAAEGGPKGPALVKAGAEGVYGAMLPGLGLGVALKIDDGTTRASEVAMAAILDVLGVFDAPLRKNLHAVIEPTVFNAAGDNVGVVRASSTLSENGS